MCGNFKIKRIYLCVFTLHVSLFQPSTPAPYVKEMNDAGQFYTNRVLKDWKEK
jgi:hypothetical protein